MRNESLQIHKLTPLHVENFNSSTMYAVAVVSFICEHVIKVNIQICDKKLGPRSSYPLRLDQIRIETIKGPF